ncbi:hypothetical protein Tco_1555727 [Tanacetum coccineum]
MTEFPQMDLGLAIPLFNQGDDPIACLNRAMAFLTVVASSRVTVQQVQGRQGQSYAGTGYKGNALSQRGLGMLHGLRKKAMLAEAQESGQILDEEQLAFLADPGIPDGQASQTTIPNTASFQTKDLNAYDFDCDDVSNAKESLMYGSDVILEVPHFEPNHTDMDNQSVHAIQCFEQTPIFDFTDNEITSDSNIIPYSQYLQETQQAAVQETNLDIDFGRKLSDEQAFWLQTSHPNTDQSASSPVKIKAPKELPKVILVNTSLKKLKYHLGQFDTMVKKQITPDAITEGEWGFEHTKTVFLNKIIPFLKNLKDIFNVFDKDLLNEVTKVQTVFNQMEAVVQQYFVEKQCFEIHKKHFLIENDRLLDQIISQDIMNIVVNSSLDINTSVNVNSSAATNDSVNYVEMCNKCLETCKLAYQHHIHGEKDEYNKLLK